MLRNQTRILADSSRLQAYLIKGATGAIPCHPLAGLRPFHVKEIAYSAGTTGCLQHPKADGIIKHHKPTTSPLPGGLLGLYEEIMCFPGASYYVVPGPTFSYSLLLVVCDGQGIDANIVS